MFMPCFKRKKVIKFSDSSYLLFFSFIYLSRRLITLQYSSGFCHTLIWISHGFTCVPHPEPPSHLPPHSYLVFYYWILRVLCVFKIQHTCQIYDLKILSPQGCHCTFLIVFFEAQILSTLSSSIFLFVVDAFGIISKKPLPSLRPWIFTPIFFARSYIILVLTWFSIHSELILVCGVR